MSTRRKSTINPKTQEMVLTAILLAIALIMAFTPLGYPVIAGVFEIALIIIPVAIGSVVMGWKAGLLLGTVFGISSYLIAMGIGMHPNPFASFLFQQNPFFTAVICLVPRIICGVAPALIYKAISANGTKRTMLAIPVACVSAALLNTVLFLGLIWVFFSGAIEGNNDYLSAIMNEYGSFNFITFFLFCALLPAPVEIGLCGVLGTAVSKPLLMLKKRMSC